MKKKILWIFGVILLVLIAFYFIGSYSFKKALNNPELYETYKEIDKKNPGSVADSSVEINLIPEYGGLEKTAEQKNADKEFIESIMQSFDSEKEASDAVIDLAEEFYQKGDLETAMKRYNQAWLLNSENPNIYFGFAKILEDWGQRDDSQKMLEKAERLRENNDKYNIFEGVESFELQDVTGGDAMGQAWIVVRDGKTFHKAEGMNLPVLGNNDFYEGWLVKKTPELDFFSTGKMIQDQETGKWILNYEAEGDKSDYPEVVITLEPDDGDPAPAAHILEGIKK